MSAADGSAEPARRAHNREELYRAALALFAEQGYEATTMADIARRAGFARRSAFNHFPAKSDITVEWTSRRRAAARPVDTALPEDVPTRVRDWFRALGELSESTERETEQMLRGWLGAAGPVDHPTGTTEELRAWLDEGQQHGAIDVHIDVAAAAALLFDAYLGALYRWLRSPTPRDGTLVTEIDTVVDLVLRGLQPTTE